MSSPSIHQIQDFKLQKKPITMLTCYDYSFAKVLSKTEIDILLVGDSVAMVQHGYPNTLGATVEMMAVHTRAVKQGAPNKFVVADMPFMSFRKGLGLSLEAAETLMRAGADAIKIEGVLGHEDVIRHCVQSGIPVMGHLGLTPQSLHQLGGHKVQGKKEADAIRIQEEARSLEALGSFSVVLECVPRTLAKKISQELRIPCIGIGAGSDCDGQVLVLQDMLGMNPDFNPKFLRKYSNLSRDISEAVGLYIGDVREKRFPTNEESYEP